MIPEHTTMTRVTYVREQFGAVRELLPNESLKEAEREMMLAITRLVRGKGGVFAYGTFKTEYDIVMRYIEIEVVPGIMEDLLVDLRRITMSGYAWLDVRPEHREAMSMVKTDRWTWDMPVIEPLTASRML